MTAGVAVFDRQTRTFTEQHHPHLRFRSASVVKLLIALDHLWDRGPDHGLPADDRARLDSMLRASDDTSATYYWSRNGGSAIVDRMVSRLGLADTVGPRRAIRGSGDTRRCRRPTPYGSTATSWTARRSRSARSSWGTCVSPRGAARTASTSGSASRRRSSGPGR
ncbi:hypothetical protein AB0N31_14240 [Streptomyces sp. NPDC051051]|uniref:hypothetical protein n=1 Tax=Streptomyces sp. NPDC051051 TaxID=3155666 RepID=UPI00344A6840